MSIKFKNISILKESIMDDIWYELDYRTVDPETGAKRTAEEYWSAIKPLLLDQYEQNIYSILVDDYDNNKAHNRITAVLIAAHIIEGTFINNPSKNLLIGSIYRLICLSEKFSVHAIYNSLLQIAGAEAIKDMVIYGGGTLYNLVYEKYMRHNQDRDRYIKLINKISELIYNNDLTIFLKDVLNHDEFSNNPSTVGLFIFIIQHIIKKQGWETDKPHEPYLDKDLYYRAFTHIFKYTSNAYNNSYLTRCLDFLSPEQFNDFIMDNKQVVLQNLSIFENTRRTIPPEVYHEILNDFANNIDITVMGDDNVGGGLQYFADVVLKLPNNSITIKIIKAIEQRIDNNLDDLGKNNATFVLYTTFLDKDDKPEPEAYAYIVKSFYAYSFNTWQLENENTFIESEEIGLWFFQATTHIIRGRIFEILKNDTSNVDLYLFIFKRLLLNLYLLPPDVMDDEDDDGEYQEIDRNADMNDTMTTQMNSAFITLMTIITNIDNHYVNKIANIIMETKGIEPGVFSECVKVLKRICNRMPNGIVSGTTRALMYSGDIDSIMAYIKQGS